MSNRETGAEAWANRLKLATWVLSITTGLLCAIGLGGIAWAFTVQADLASMKSDTSAIRATVDKIETVPEWLVKSVDDLRLRVRELEREVAEHNGGP